ncbi:uncharacterized protein LOC114359290 [Ostrinia furnacalis]|uniref:uncharacterized protein LOC114359290 n=1 Tax=Ostrinia furnacalis TaxID=93504 RepID=UPI00103E9235|nr:uncharacterized protein LOC114359290 [Ostrinia furnacalis]
MTMILFPGVPTWSQRPDPHELSQSQKSILDEVSWSVKLMLLREYFPHLDETKRVGGQAYVRVKRDIESPPTDDNDMKLKLFRLMYETVRDSDLKVKRAELINAYYVNSTSFEIGYLLGDVTDKFNIMSDISSTLKRLYESWKPIEHINAYEQIANQAIEISHLIDMIRTVNKRGMSQDMS